MQARIVYQRYSKQNLAALLFLTIVLAIILMLVITDYINKVVGHALLDTTIGYDVDQASAVFAALSGDNAILYYILLCVDTVFPFSYASSAALLMVPLQGALFRPESKLNNLVFLPYIAMAFDYIENMLLFSQFLQYPALNPEVIAVASVFTAMKWIAVIMMAVVLIVEGTAYLYFYFREK